MRETIRKEFGAKLAIAIYITFTIWWATLQFPPNQDNLSNKLFGSLYFLNALIGVVYGLRTASHWGGFKSKIGKALTFFSFGLLGQVIGQCIYTYYYYIAKIEVPYPSWGDLGYFGSIPLYIFGVYYLAKPTGAIISLKSIKNKIVAFILPIFVSVISYIVLLNGHEMDFSNPLKTFLDFGYPFGESIYLSLTIIVYLLSRKMLGGLMKHAILLLLFGMFIQYIADFSFLYLSYNGLWYSGGINDIFYITAYFLMTMALLQLKTVFVKLKHQK